MAKWRNIIEMSGMKNNDEWILYTDGKLDDLGDTVINFNALHLSSPSLVLSREVMLVEIEQGLDTSWEGSYWDEERPPVTESRDDFVKLKQDLEIKMNVQGMDIEEAISDCLASTFYSPMSSGCGRFYLSACRYFVEQYDLDMSTQVYPSKKGENGEWEWDTFVEFFKEIERIPRLEDVAPSLGMSDLKLLGS